MTRTLFHGTSAKFRPSILRHGELRPRGRTGKSVYDGKLVSAPDRVYLTDVYALAFGMIAVGKYGGPLVVCKCIVDEAALLPDTDFEEGGEHSKRFDHWQDCLRDTGCVSVRGAVPVRKVYTIKGEALADLRESTLRIETGFRHQAFRKMHDEALNYYLMVADTVDVEA